MPSTSSLPVCLLLTMPSVTDHAAPVQALIALLLLVGGCLTAGFNAPVSRAACSRGHALGSSQHRPRFGQAAQASAA